MSQRREKKHSVEDIRRAVEEVRKGASLRAMTAKYGIPRSTLQRNIHKEELVATKKGPQTLFSYDQEQTLVDWVKWMARGGFPLSKESFLWSVGKLALELGIQYKGEAFIPKRKWYEGFMRRHPELTRRISQNLTQQRGAVQQSDLDDWFNDLERYFRQEDLLQVFDDPRRILNGDETEFFLNPKPGKVLAEKGCRTVYTGIGSDEKQNLTVLLTGNAAGEMAPPMVVYRYARVPLSIAKNMPHGWGIGRSETGWMMQETFFEYVCNILEPWLTTSNVQRPVIFFLDGHVSHLSYPLSKFCKEKGIELIALYPNATHLIQPMDVAVFHSLKTLWKQHIAEWRLTHDGQQVTKQEFPLVLQSVLQKLPAESIISGFRACGLMPWNPKAVTVKKGELEITTKVTTKTMQDLKTFMKVFENEVRRKTLQEFNQSGSQWVGDISKTALFNVWKSVQNKLQNEGSQHMAEVSHAPPAPAELENTELQVGEGQASLEIILEKNLAELTPSNIPSVKITPEKDSVEPGPSNVPTPFKRTLFWPKQNITSKKQKREKLPSVVTSSQMLQYLKTKEEKKKSQEEEREKKRKIREEKKLKAESLKKAKKMTSHKFLQFDSSSTSSSEVRFEDILNEEENILSSESEIDLEPCHLNNISVGKFILVELYGGKRNSTKCVFLCTVLEVHGEEVKVQGFTSMNPKKKEFLLKDNDIFSINIKQILGVPTQPELTSAGRRIAYIFKKKVPVMEKP